MNIYNIFEQLGKDIWNNYKYKENIIEKIKEFKNGEPFNDNNYMILYYVLNILNIIKDNNDKEFSDDLIKKLINLHKYEYKIDDDYYVYYLAGYHSDNESNDELQNYHIIKQINEDYNIKTDVTNEDYILLNSINKKIVISRDERINILKREIFKDIFLTENIIHILINFINNNYKKNIKYNELFKKFFFLKKDELEKKMDSINDDLLKKMNEKKEKYEDYINKSNIHIGNIDKILDINSHDTYKKEFDNLQEAIKLMKEKIREYKKLKVEFEKKMQIQKQIEELEGEIKKEQNELKSNEQQLNEEKQISESNEKEIIKKLEDAHNRIVILREQLQELKNSSRSQSGTPPISPIKESNDSILSQEKTP